MTKCKGFVVLLIGLLLTIGGGIVHAGPSEDAAAAHIRGDYATALRLFRQLADQGDDHAQYNLGVMYAYGKGVPQNYVEAVKWYRLAADQGYVKAQNNLGTMYATGRGVSQNPSRRISRC